MKEQREGGDWYCNSEYTQHLQLWYCVAVLILGKTPTDDRPDGGWVACLRSKKHIALIYGYEKTTLNQEILPNL